MARVAFLLDENVKNALAVALLHRFPDRVVRVQDVGLRQAEDSEILEFAAAQQRVIVTGDRATVAEFVEERIQSQLPMAGLIVLRPSATVASVVEAAEVIVDCCTRDDWADRIEYLPFE